MGTVAIQIDLEEFINQLSPQQEKELSRKIWAKEMDKIVSKMRTNIKRQKLSWQQIQQIISKARKEYYEKNSNRR